MSQSETELPSLARIPVESLTVRSSGYREYTDEFKAQALMALELNDGNVSATARQLNIPRDTLNSWRSGIGITENVLRIQRGVKGPLADQFEQTARLYLEHAQKPEIIEKTSGYYAVIAASDSMKSSQLLRGEPTEIHSMSEQDRQLRLAELLERLQSRAGG